MAVFSVENKAILPGFYNVFVIKVYFWHIFLSSFCCRVLGSLTLSAENSLIT